MGKWCKLVLALGLVACAGVSSGCAGGADRSARASDDAGVGAIDVAYRRIGGDDAVNIFEALDLPTPNERRLGSGAPGPAYWQQRADYKIDAALDAESRRLTASMVCTYTNNSPHTLDFLWLQLEQNLFRPDSVGSQSRTSGSIMRLHDDGFDGGYDLGPLIIDGREQEYHVYDTLARVDLDDPIEPGEVVSFALDFAFTMPPHLRRMGAEDVEQGTIFEYAQWFPHVCNYDDVHGWNTLPYLGTGEFYTNFGDYEVNLTVPRDFIVGATGTLQNPYDVLTETQRERLAEATASDEPVYIVYPGEVGEPATRPRGTGPLTWRFKAENVRTFAWAASQAFIWDACVARITDLDGAARTVLCQSLYPKEAESWYVEDDGGGSTRYVKHSVEFTSDFLYPYPYPQMTNVNGPEGGMEYPMIIYCGARTNDRGLFGVTDHEVGHTWFPMIVNTDERRYVWQDEGFTSFVDQYSTAAWYETDLDTARALTQSMRIFGSARRQPINTRPDTMWPRWVGALAYRKTALGLTLLREEILGPERFDRAFRAYVERWAFKHPQPADFFRTMEDVAGADLAWFWRGWFLSTGTLDQAIAGVEVVDDGRIIVTLDNRAEMVMPTIVRVAYADGTSETRRLPVEIWHTTDRWRASWRTGGKTPVEVAIDPEVRFPDTDRSNNTWSVTLGRLVGPSAE